MMYFDPSIIFDALRRAQEDRRVREQYWSTLPDDEAKAARARWEYDEMLRRQQRDHEIAVAKAGRPLNFWGQ